MASSTSMAHSLTSSTAAAAAAVAATKTPISITSTKKTHHYNNITTNVSLLPPTSLRNRRLVPARACHEQCISSGIDHNSVKSTSIPSRRSVTLGLTGAMLGLTLDAAEDRSSIAAARRPPPPPPAEKQDPNVSGVLAKVLASKKRKEAMKDAMAKLREKGKSITTEPSN